MKILVTGSSGFIGTHLVKLLLEKGNDIMGLDWRDPKESADTYEHVDCDILDAGAVVGHFERFRPEVVIHLAAKTSLKEVPPGSRHFAANTEGTENIMRGAEASGTTRRTIFTSTKYVFRDGIPKHDKDYNPKTCYGQSKVDMEKLVWENDGCCSEWCIARPTTVWGPGMSTHYQRFLGLVKKGWYFHMGSGEARKHMSFVGNIAVQFERLAVADASAIHQKVFYLTDYEALILREWVEAFAQAFGSGKVRNLPLPLARLAGRIGDLIAKAGFGKFPLTSFRVKNLTEEDICDPGLTEKVCGALPYEVREGAEITKDWYLKLKTAQQIEADR